MAFMIADHAEAKGGKLYMTGGGWDQLSAHTFPTTHPHMTLAVTMLVPSTRLNEEHRFRIRLLDADNTIAAGFDVGGQFEAGRPPGHREGDSVINHLAINLNNTVFESAGNYRFVLEVDGEERAEAPFKVVKLRQGPSTG